MKKLGAITIDENNRRFKINGRTKPPKTDGIVKKSLKGSLAISTMGMSVLAEKAIAGSLNSSNWISYDSLLNFQIRRDNVRESTGIRTGAFKSGLGLGVSSRSSKSVTYSMDILVNLDDLNLPYVVVPIIDKPLKGKEAAKAQAYCDDTVSALNYILRHR